MRKSKAVPLLLCTSLAIFGVGHVVGCDDGQGYYDPEGNWVATTQPVDEYDGWEPEPVYLDGVMGVYSPTTHVFIASTSPEFGPTCTVIKSNYVASAKAGSVTSTSVRGGFGAMGGKSGIAS